MISKSVKLEPPRCGKSCGEESVSLFQEGRGVMPVEPFPKTAAKTARAPKHFRNSTVLAH